MSQVFMGWPEVAENLLKIAKGNVIELKDGQRASLRALATRLQCNSVIIADEVGMGKTRIAAVVANSVIAAGGRVAILVPPGLGYQWGEELRRANVEAPPILRSLRQYLQAWESKDCEKQRPWFSESVVLISHAFTNWRLAETSTPWRWALLPELYARWRKTVGKKLPKTTDDDKFKDWKRYRELRNKDADDDCRESIPNDEMLRRASIRAALSIANGVHECKSLKQERDILDVLIQDTPWPGALNAGEYARNEHLRPWLEQAVGLGLGVFDLVIIDEAHKSRGQDSGLNRLVEHVVLQSATSRRLAMTATPVELDAEQWKQTLGRIKADLTPKASADITGYADAVRKVRQCPNDVETRNTYKIAAAGFKLALEPYLLRRDKREDEFVKKFQDYSKEGFHAYRRESEILVDTAALSAEWKQAVCAAEALSFVTRQSDDAVAKRLRLTLGNGHGLAALIDQTHQHEEIASSDKRLLRAQWWKKVMMLPSRSAELGDSALYDHPAILAAVKEIELVSQQGEKVLVFGRFTRPLRALVKLLNAREMLRCLDTNQLWPQSKVAEDKDDHLISEWVAVQAAHRQLARPSKLLRDDLDRQLGEQYGEFEKQRINNREHLLEKIAEGISKGNHNHRIQTLFEALKMNVNDGHSLAVVTRAVTELIGPDIDSATPKDFATAFANIVDAACDRDESDSDGNGELDADEAEELLPNLITRLHAEYSRPEGGFARLMNGNTKPATRRLLQLAFNRTHSHPKVLVAQSVVGREGLNLHEACRTVVLLHPEWNPGVVEQQIGRVDRIGSLWQSKLEEAIEKKIVAADVPRIEIRPVIFQGTYDEKNWKILRNRWDDLRAQLHGIVISSRIAESYQNAELLIEEINKEAPNFSPS